ncbi:MAG: adenine deaminase [Bacteroidales bacterium]|nr:adenine deaminase [Bacteroidales bacterium]
MKISGHLVDIHLRKIYPAEIIISNGVIDKIIPTSNVPDQFILPGLIDSHIHIESSMVTPGAFGYEAVKHGTTGLVSDPHEIANVMGLSGIEFMIEDSKRSPVKFWFGAPSCVPATSFETSGAELDAKVIEGLLKRPDIKYLSEMMNYPGVIFRDAEVIKKLEAAKIAGKPADGHAPGLTGENLRIYIESGISTDHECSTIEEAREKISLGMKVLIREGSAARNLDSLMDLFEESPEMVMLCSDDLHPEMLVKGHINKLVAKLVSRGFNIFDVIRSATLNPVKHYNLEAGLLREGDPADFIIVDGIGSMVVKQTWIGGKKVFDEGVRSFRYEPELAINNFICSSIKESDIQVLNRYLNFRVIEASDGELLTKELIVPAASGNFLNTDTSRDILKIVVKGRYSDSLPVAGFIKGFGLKEGAFAGSIAHDSHNIVCVGVNDTDIVNAINEIVRIKGGLAVSVNGKTDSLTLDIGGIMTTRSCMEVAEEYSKLTELIHTSGCKMTAPFMTLSFMALLVIPDLKIGDKGLFDVIKFKPVSLFTDDDSPENILL